MERKNNNGNYTPENCRWATYKEQQRNRRNNHRIVFCGKMMCLSEVAEHLGLKYGTLWARLKRGIPLDQELRVRGGRLDKAA